MCKGAKIYMLWKKTDETEGSKHKRNRLRGEEAVSMVQVEASCRQGEKQAFTPPSCPRDHVLRPAAWHALPAGDHIPW